MRKALMLTLICWVTSCSLLSTVGAAPPEGDTEFRAAWTAMVAPLNDPAQGRSLEAVQQASLIAIGHMDAAIAADPKNPVYQSSLAYLCMIAGKYDKAKEAINRAINMRRNEPLWYFLRGQSEAALAQMDPATAGEHIEPALVAFDRAAELDPTNALPFLSATSVALDANRLDLAIPRVKKALQRTVCKVYLLPTPFDLFPDAKKSVNSWRSIQQIGFVTLLARCANVAAVWSRNGKIEEDGGKLDSAEDYFKEELKIARLVGQTQPNTFVAVGISIGLLARAYDDLARVAEQKKSNELDQWKGERGVLLIGQEMLQAAYAEYTKDIEQNPPSSFEALLSCEAKYVAPIIAGIGLSKPAISKDSGQAKSPHSSPDTAGK